MIELRLHLLNFPILPGALLIQSYLVVQMSVACNHTTIATVGEVVSEDGSVKFSNVLLQGSNGTICSIRLEVLSWGRSKFSSNPNALYLVLLSGCTSGFELDITGGCQDISRFPCFSLR